LPDRNGDLLQFDASEKPQDIDLLLVALSVGLFAQLDGKDAIAPQLEAGPP
jgi:hypothetical protein